MITIVYGQSTAYRCGILKRPVLDREARFAAGKGATTLADHPFSLITASGCLVHPMQESSRWDLTRGDLCSRLHARETEFHFESGPTGLDGIWKSAMSPRLSGKRAKLGARRHRASWKRARWPTRTCPRCRAGRPPCGKSSKAWFPLCFESRDLHFENRVLVYSFFSTSPGVSGIQLIQFPSLPANSVRTCPQPTRPAPIYSA